MAGEVSDDAVVLRRFDSSESDRRLTLLTQNHGKLDVVAKGARKAGSRLAGSSEPVVRATFTWAPGRARNFVTQVQPHTSYPPVRSDYGKLLAATALCELYATSVPYESPEADEHGLFSLLSESLEHLGGASDWRPAMVWAQVRLLDREGVLPSWTVCVATGSRLSDNPAYLSVTAGGHVSFAHGAEWHDKTAVSAEALVALDKIGELEAPPTRVVGANECLRVLFYVWRASLQVRLNANEAMIQNLPAE